MPDRGPVGGESGIRGCPAYFSITASIVSRGIVISGGFFSLISHTRIRLMSSADSSGKFGVSSARSGRSCVLAVFRLETVFLQLDVCSARTRSERALSLKGSWSSTPFKFDELPVVPPLVHEPASELDERFGVVVVDGGAGGLVAILDRGWM